MRFRYTIKVLQEWSDYELLKRIVTERQSDCRNVYSPLAKRLEKLYDKLDKNQALTIPK